MCGIAGFTHRRNAVDPQRIATVIGSLVHRGPDEERTYETASVSIGAARLAIRDLAGGSQPITSDDGDTTIAFNGEIYNCSELERELRKLGHHLHGKSDTEVVLHAFLQWGNGCFSRMRGMFAVALWTESRKWLVLARDRLGIKPLYIHRRDADLYFGSELKAIFAHPEIERRLDPIGLEQYLCLNYVPCPRTLVENIEKLPPGTWLEWRDGRIETEAYWKLERGAQRFRTLGEATEQLDWLMDSAVKEHLLSDVDLGVWSSGGLDSSAILHYAAMNSRSRVKTFSISFRGRSFDERQYFREVATKYETDHHEFDLNSGVNLQDAVEQLPYYMDEPIADAGALPVWYLSRLSRQHVTVALSGEGADELFGGYLSYRADSLVRRLALVPRHARSIALRALRHWPVSNDKVSLEYKVKRLLDGSLLAPDASHCFWNGGFSPEERSSLLKDSSGDGVRALFAGLPANWTSDLLHRYLWFDQTYYLPDDILTKCDRMSMAHGLEVRPPFLDHRVVEFAASLPARWKIDGRRQKVILRRVMAPHLPHTVLALKKEGFDIPSAEWLRGPLFPLLMEALTPEAIAGIQIFSASALQAMIAAHLEKRRNFGVPLWGLLILFLWIRYWRIDCAAPWAAITETGGKAAGDIG